MEINRNVRRGVVVLGVLQIAVILVLTSSRLSAPGAGVMRMDDEREPGRLPQLGKGVREMGKLSDHSERVQGPGKSLQYYSQSKNLSKMASKSSNPSKSETIHAHNLDKPSLNQRKELDFENPMHYEDEINMPDSESQDKSKGTEHLRILSEDLLPNKNNKPRTGDTGIRTHNFVQDSAPGYMQPTTHRPALPGIVRETTPFQRVKLNLVNLTKLSSSSMDQLSAGQAPQDIRHRIGPSSIPPVIGPDLDHPEKADQSRFSGVLPLQGVPGSPGKQPVEHGSNLDHIPTALAQKLATGPDSATGRQFVTGQGSAAQGGDGAAPTQGGVAPRGRGATRRLVGSSPGYGAAPGGGGTVTVQGGSAPGQGGSASGLTPAALVNSPSTNLKLNLFPSDLDRLAKGLPPNIASPPFVSQSAIPAANFQQVAGTTSVPGRYPNQVTENPGKIVSSFPNRFSTDKPRILPKDPFDAHLAVYQWRCTDDENLPSNKTIAASGKPLCPCISKNLVGKLNPWRWQDISVKLTWERVNLLADALGVTPGGSWSPPDCYPRKKVAVVVPSRDRELHLRTFLAYMHPILQRHRLEYRIFVLEQAWPEIHNKGSMMNVGYLEAKRLYDFDCLIFHDVDLLLEDDRNIYTCWEYPIHFGAYVDKLGYSLIYNIIFGGAVGMKPETFESVNGYSNNYFGWGGEDDDFSMRLRTKKINFYRPSVEIARYTSLKHPKDSANPVNPHRGRAVQSSPEQYARDGLTSISYKVLRTEKYPLYTWIHASLNISDAVDYPYRSVVEYQESKAGYCLSATKAMLPLSLISCKYACDTKTGCEAFVYADKADDDFRCYLRNTAGCAQYSQNPDYTMYTKIQETNYTRWSHNYSTHIGLDCPGQDLVSLWSNKAQCGRACDQDMLCDGFTYLEEERGQARCWLKRQCRDGQRLALAMVKYYHKRAFIGPGNEYGLTHTFTRLYVKDCPGNDLSVHFTSVGRCAKLCDQSPVCVAALYSFTLSMPCLLKSVCFPQQGTDPNLAMFIKVL